MTNLLVQLMLGAAVPVQSPITKRLVTLTDGANAVQTATLDGSESPPWSVLFSSVDDGAGSVSAQDQDAGGNAVGASVSVSYPAVTQPVTSQPTASINVTRQ
jgi:hypothetical protein